MANFGFAFLATNTYLTTRFVPVQSIPRPKFKKVIFMLVDSLRADFITNPTSGFSFVRSLLEQGQAYSYKAFAHPPTVTLPRVKALVTGGIPSFSDYLANFQSSEITQDNIVWQMQRHSKCVVFYGDETWLKLLPNSFTRQEGTTSFFVADTVIVDSNVTRNLLPEMERYKASAAKRALLNKGENVRRVDADQEGASKEKIKVQAGGDANTKHPDDRYPETIERHVCESNADWDVMILHYLGLDHVGHLQGPRSPLMYPKQVEMNSVYESLYKEIDSDTILVLSGDHGMNEEGAHGGPSDGETSPALVLASPAFKNIRPDRAMTSTKIDQIDVVPTLMTFLGLPTPLNSVGKLIPDVVSQLYESQPVDLLRAYELNALQIHRLLKTSPTICRGGTLRQYHSSHTCEGVSESARSAIASFENAKRAHAAFVSELPHGKGKPENSQNFETAIQSYQAFLHATSPLFAHALSEYDDYLLLTAILGFAVAAAFAYVSFSRPLKRHPPFALVGLCAFCHFLFDSLLLLSIGSSLSSLPKRIATSILMGYCLAHVGVHLRRSVSFPSKILECFHNDGFGAAASSLVGSVRDFVVSSISASIDSIAPQNTDYMSNGMGSGIISEHTSSSASSGGFATSGKLLAFILILGTVLRPILYSSSSFIEEEHLTFFFFGCTTLFALIQSAILQNCDTPTFALIALALVAMRSSRLWNQTGFQGSGKPDVAQSLNVFYPGIRNFLVLLTFVLMAAFVLYHLYKYISRYGTAPMRHYGIFAILNRSPVNVPRLTLQAWTFSWCMGLFGTFIYQTTGSHGWAQLAHYGALFGLILALFWLASASSSDSPLLLGDCMLLLFWTFCGLSFLLCRFHNIPLLGLWFLQAHIFVKISQGFSFSLSSASEDSSPAKLHSNLVKKLLDVVYCGSLSSSGAGGAYQGSSSRSGGLQLPLWVWSLLLFNMGQYAYFSQGNSNSLASIDIAGAYAGLSGYQDGLVALFVAMLLYAGPLSFQFSLLLIFVFQEQENGGSLSLDAPNLNAQARRRIFDEQPLHLALLEALRVRFLARVWSVVIYAIFITFQHRGHLFIWSVFAPKLLYEIFHSIALTIQVVVYLVFCVAYTWYSRQIKVGGATHALNSQRQENFYPPSHAASPPPQAMSPIPSAAYYEANNAPYRSSPIPKFPSYTDRPHQNGAPPSTASHVFSI